MDRTEAKAEAQSIVGADLAALIADPDWERALDQSLTLDLEGRAPGMDGYVDAFDPYWTAAEAITAVAVRQEALGGTIKRFTSEGSSFEMTAPNLWAAANTYRARSGLARMAEGLGRLEVDGRLSDYSPTSGRGGSLPLSVLSNGAVIPAELDWTS